MQHQETGQQNTSVNSSAKIACVGRQPIFDRKQRVFGYELLFRSDQQATANTAGQGDHVSTVVMHNSLSVIGLETLTGGRRAFVNITRQLLLDGDYDVLPKEAAVVELLEDITPDPEVLQACHQLKAAGYTLALDDVVSTEGFEPLLELADIVKVDFMGTTHAQREQMAEQLRGVNVKVLAEKVETHEEFAQAQQLGYAYFQGYFFSKPQIVAASDIPGVNHNYLQMMVEINRPETDLDRLGQLIKTDVSLSTKLLRYLNSASLGVRNKITSVKQALVLLGTRPLKKWATLVFMANIGKDKPDELMVVSLIRAGFCESMAQHVGLADRTFDLFMMGMLSTLDVLMGRPIQEVLGPIPLAADVKATLTGQSTVLSDLYNLAVACERVDRPACLQLAGRCGVDIDRVDEIYRQSITWADRAIAA